MTFSRKLHRRKEERAIRQWLAQGRREAWEATPTKRFEYAKAGCIQMPDTAITPWGSGVRLLHAPRRLFPSGGERRVYFLRAGWLLPPLP